VVISQPHPAPLEGQPEGVVGGVGSVGAVVLAFLEVAHRRRMRGGMNGLSVAFLVVGGRLQKERFVFLQRGGSLLALGKYSDHCQRMNGRKSLLLCVMTVRMSLWPSGW
jgi:hypothetical protein